MNENPKENEISQYFRDKYFCCSEKSITFASAKWGFALKKREFIINPVEKFGCLQPLKKMLKLRIIPHLSQHLSVFPH